MAIVITSLKMFVYKVFPLNFKLLFSYDQAKYFSLAGLANKDQLVCISLLLTDGYVCVFVKNYQTRWDLKPRPWIIAVNLITLNDSNAID